MLDMHRRSHAAARAIFMNQQPAKLRFVSPGPWNRVAVVFAATFGCSYIIFLLAQVASTPDLGVHCLFSTKMVHLDPLFLADESQNMPPEGSKITALAGQTVDTWPALLRALAGIGSHVDSSGQVQMDLETPDGQSIHVVLEPKEQTLAGLAPTLAWLVPKLALVAVAGALLWRSAHAIPRQFFLLSLMSMLGYLGGFHWMRIAPNPWLLTPFLVAAAYLPIVSLHFNLIFPRQNLFFTRFRGLIMLALYIPPALFALFGLGEYWHIKGLSLAARDVEGAILVDGAVSWLASVIHMYIGFSFISFLVGIWALIASWRRATNETEKNQVKWILYGALASAAPLAYSLYLVILDPDKFGQGAANWPMFAASLFMTVAYSISLTGYGLMQIDRMLSTGFLRFLTSTLVGAGYYLLVLLTFLVVSQVGMVGHSWPQALAGGIAALAIAVLLDIARSRLKRLLDRRLRRDRQRLEETLQQMSRTIDSLLDEGELARTFLPIAMDLIGTASGAVYLIDNSSSSVTGSLEGAEVIIPGQPAKSQRLRIRAKLGAWRGAEEIPLDPLLARGQQISFHPSAIFQNKNMRPISTGVAQPLIHEGHILGVLYLHDPLEDALGREEKGQIQALAQVASLALASTRGHKLIDSLSREMQAKVDKIAEQQKRILSLQTQLRNRTDSIKPTDNQSLTTGGGLDLPQVTRNPGGIIGGGPGIQRVLNQIHRVAPTGTAVLIQGESGTGKELVAQAIHESSPRALKPFIKVHCGALSTPLLESELFGHVRGAFTSAFNDKTGRFEAAQGGTIFLDEIGDIGSDLQVKLLRVLQEKTIERVGSSESVKVDVRVIAATHRDLEAMVANREFRQDLYYRLRVFPIEIPPLRERLEDLPELVRIFLARSAASVGRIITGMEDKAIAVMKSHDWPGNVRELQHCVERAVVLADGDYLVAEDFILGPESTCAGGTGQKTRPFRIDPSGKSALPTARAARLQEESRLRDELTQALLAAKGNKSAAARRLKIPRSTLVSQLRKFNLE